MNAPRESQTWAISQVGLMICPQHVEFFYIIMKKISEKSREKSDDVAWKKEATWLLILGTKAGRPKNGMETGESCSGNDVSIWWLMERYDVFGIADLMVRHLRRSRVDTFCPSSFVCFGPSSSRNIVQLSSSSKCNFRTLAEGANDLGHFAANVSKVRWGILRNVLCIYCSRHTILICPILSMFPLIFMLDLKDLFLWKIKQSNNERLICKQFSLWLFYSWIVGQTILFSAEKRDKSPIQIILIISSFVAHFFVWVEEALSA